MRHTLVKFSQLALLTLVAFGLPASPSFAAEYWLCAKSFSMAMPDTTSVPMWGFALSNASFADNCSNTATVPGPKLTVGSGDSTLTIHLRNDLTGSGIEPVSIVIPGQAMPTTVASPGPVFVGNRVRSFVQEAGTSSGTETYTWSNLQPGTYLYESGTHPQVQVQMGLYGAVTKDSAADTAYPSVTYTEERDVFYSEVDPALHASVNAGTFSGSTLNYQPKYFLLHGWNGSAWEDKSIDTGMVPLMAGDCIDSGIGQGDRLLLRLYNAGLRELAPMLLGAHFDLVAEGGKPYPFARTQYQTLLMPGSTNDAVFTPAYEDDFKIIERRLNLTDSAASGGGMQTCITVAGVSNNAPVVTITGPVVTTYNSGDSITFSGTASDTEDGVISGNLSWTSSINGSIGSGASFSTNALSAGVHTITASVTDSGGLSGSDTISITVVDPTNMAPVVTVTAPADGHTVDEGTSITFTGTATDAEDGNIAGSLSWSSSIDGSIGSGNSFSTSALSVGSHTITASLTDSGGLPGSYMITVTVNVVTNTAPVVTITNPLTGATYTDAASIPFTGTASDAEEGILTGSLSWNSDADGNIGSGGSFSSTLSQGMHTITASVTDGGGLPGSASIMVNIIPASTDTLFCNRARYQRGPDRMTIEVESSDNSGALTMTGVLDVDGDGFGDADDVALNAQPFTAQNASVYRQVTNNFTGTYVVTPTSTSQVRVTSSLGGQCTSYVQAR